MANLPGKLLAIDEGGEERGPLNHLLVSWAADPMCQCNEFRLNFLLSENIFLPRSRAELCPVNLLPAAHTADKLSKNMNSEIPSDTNLELFLGRHLQNRFS